MPRNAPIVARPEGGAYIQWVASAATQGGKPRIFITTVDANGQAQGNDVLVGNGKPGGLAVRPTANNQGTAGIGQYVADVSGSSTSAGGQVHQWDCVGGEGAGNNNQLWRLNEDL